MKIKNIQLKNFRNYPELRLQFDSDVVVLTGPNAVGKTNLIESVYFSSLFKSFRDDTEYIFLKETGEAELKVLVEAQGVERFLEVFLSKKDKVYANFFIDGVKTKKHKAQGLITTVIFEPGDVDLFSKAPEVRRKYLNMVLSQKDILYLNALVEYKKALFQKNRLLGDYKKGKNTNIDSLSSWNEQVAALGAVIIEQRRKLINFFNVNLADVYRKISGFERPIEVDYTSVQGEDKEEIAKAILELLEKYKEKEKAAGTSLVGPHRDDFFLKSEGVFLSPFSSRGELRSQILALKILELEYLSRGDDKPVLLLDDVLSELDETRRTFLLKYLKNKFQTFITTTHPLEMPAQHITLTPAENVVQE